MFEEFAKSDAYGMIFTYMWAFDQPSDWAYIEQVKEIFAPYNTTLYYVELVASQQVRLERNATENRLKNKAFKRDLASSNRRLLADDAAYRLESLPGEIPFDNYLRIDNTNLSPEETARIICERFSLA